MKIKSVILLLVAVLAVSVGVNIYLLKPQSSNSSQTQDGPGRNISPSALASKSGDIWSWREIDISFDTCRWSDLEPRIEDEIIEVSESESSFLRSERGQKWVAQARSLVSKTETLFENPEDYWSLGNCSSETEWTRITDWPERAGEFSNEALQETWLDLVGLVGGWPIAADPILSCHPDIAFNRGKPELYNKSGEQIGTTEIDSCEYYVIGIDKLMSEVPNIDRDYFLADYYKLVIIVVYNFKTELFNDIDGLSSFRINWFSGDYRETLLKPRELVNGSTPFNFLLENELDYYFDPTKLVPFVVSQLN